MTRVWWLWRALLCVWLALIAGRAHAAPSDDKLARAKFDEGLALSDAGRWAEALEAFVESDRIKPAVSVRFNIAATLRALGRYVDAKQTAQRILDDPDKLEPKEKMRKQAQAILEEVSAKIARLELKVQPANAHVEVDGKEIEPRPDVELDPGRHVFVVKATGYETITVTRELPSGPSRISLNAPKRPPPPAARPRTQEEEGTPVHKTWWLWTTVALAVAATAAVIVVVVVVLPEEPAAPTPPPTTVGSPIPVIFRF